MRVLGIDPGLRLTGYACIEVNASGESWRNGAVSLVEAGVFRLRVQDPVPMRLVELEADLVDAIERLRPDHVCVEKLFSHYKRPLTAIIMGHARGVTLLAAQRAGVGLSELASTEVKKSLTGRGHASKAQMQQAVRSRLGLAEPPRPPDVADAIAIALCAAARLGAPAAR